ncbi:hypothetical protein [Vibrio penaeicida]|nr:hypothetical protein [Vibrio penaeicida]
MKCPVLLEQIKGLPQNVRWLFQYSFDALQMEVNFANSVLKDLSADS